MTWPEIKAQRDQAKQAIADVRAKMPALPMKVLSPCKTVALDEIGALVITSTRPDADQPHILAEIKGFELEAFVAFVKEYL